MKKQRRKKSKELPLRYIVRATYYSVSPHKTRKVKYTRKRETYVTDVAYKTEKIDGKVRVGKTIHREAKILKSQKEVEKFIKETEKKFKKQKRFTSFTISGQVFKGERSHSKKKLYLDTKSESSRAYSTRNLTKKDSKVVRSNAVIGFLNDLDMAESQNLFSDTTAREKKRFQPKVKEKQTKEKTQLDKHLEELRAGKIKRQQRGTMYRTLLKEAKQVKLRKRK